MKSTGHITSSDDLFFMRTRRRTTDGEARDEMVAWDPRKTAVVICDMWDRHWCKGAEKRTAELAVEINETAKEARRRGVLVIHCPSDTMAFYASTPQRARALAAPVTESFAQTEPWVMRDPATEPELPIDDSDGGCGDVPPCPRISELPWSRQIATIEIAEEDAVAEGAEPCRFMRQRGIENVVLMGVHLNMCVLARQFGIRQLIKQKFNVVLMRDRTDCMYNPAMRPFITHDEANALMVAHVEKYLCASATAADFTTAARPTISVVGLGRIGAPMMAVFAEKGFNVTGADTGKDAVAAIHARKAQFQEPMLEDCLARARGKIHATLDAEEAVLASEVSFVIVPTPSGDDGAFNNRYILNAVTSIGRALKKKTGYHVVAITSTVMPGSCTGEITAALEAASGRKVGRDVGLCYNPAFIALGSVINDLLRPDMVLIGESDARAGALVEKIWRQTVESRAEFHRMALVNAELCKIAVNTFVTTKISFANMIAELCDHLPGADADVVARALGADSRIGRKYLKGAMGYGGPCFPRDNKAMSALGRSLGVPCDIAEATDRINDHQVHRLAGAVEACAPPPATVAVLGMSYKPLTPVIDESQGVALAALLAERSYRVVIFDPASGAEAKAALGERVQLATSAREAIAASDLIVITTPWEEFKTLPTECFQRDGAQLTVVDPWRVTDAKSIGCEVNLIQLGDRDSNPY